MVTSDRRSERARGTTREDAADEHGEVVHELRFRAEDLGSASNVAATAPEEYEVVVRRVAAIVAEDFTHTGGGSGRRSTRLLDAFRTVRASDGGTKADEGPVLTYDLLDSETTALLDRYREEYGGYAFDLDDEGTNAAAGRLFAAGVAAAARSTLDGGDGGGRHRTATESARGDVPDARLRLVGRQGWVLAPRSALERSNHRLYAADGVSLFVDGVVHHSLYRQHREYLDRLRARFDTLGEDDPETRPLADLLDRWERYGGTLYFPAFVEQYRRRHLDEAGPTTTVLDRAWRKIGPFARGLRDGMCSWAGEGRPPEDRRTVD